MKYVIIFLIIHFFLSLIFYNWLLGVLRDNLDATIKLASSRVFILKHLVRVVERIEALEAKLASKEAEVRRGN